MPKQINMNRDSSTDDIKSVNGENSDISSFPWDSVISDVLDDPLFDVLTDPIY